MVTEQPALVVKPRLQLSRRTVFPLVGDRAAWSQEHLLPIFATIVVSIALLFVLRPEQELSSDERLDQAWQAYWVLATYMAFLVGCYVNEMCLRARHLGLMAAVAFSIYLLLESPVGDAWFYVFHHVIPTAQWRKSGNSEALQLAGWFVGAGINEEGFKALPPFGVAALGGILAFLGGRLRGRLGALLTAVSERVGLSEPLDGIVLGVASGSGFFIYETLFQYVPATLAQGHGADSQAFDGLLLLLSRGLPQFAGHSAWSGLFGYFIGLAVLRPNRAFFLLPIGWLSAAILHAAWDSIGVVVDSDLGAIVAWVIVGLLSYALLAGAIFRAREISPRAAAAGDGATSRAQDVAPSSSDWD